MKKNLTDGIIIHHKDFEAWFIDEGEENYLPLILKPFNEQAYLFLKDLEETFYFGDEKDKLLLFIKSHLGFLNIGEMRAREDGLRSSAIYFMIQLTFKLTNQQESIFVMIKKEPKLKKRLIYLLEKHGKKLSNITKGINKNYFKNKQSKRKPIDSKLRHEVFKRDNYKCLECGITNKKSVLHVDHILPVSQGGKDELENLQTLCENCNLAKSNKYWKGGENGSSDS